MAEEAKEIIRHTGRPAAALVGIITILIVFYIVFLPPETREALLDDKNLTEAGEEAEEENMLISTTVGRLSYLAEEETDHYIPGAYLDEKEESKIFAEYDDFEISKGIFGGEGKKKLFTIPNLDQTSKVLITFQSPIRYGKLKITLNNKIIFEEELLTALPKPIDVPKEYLHKNNELEFDVEGGIFSDKEYRIEDLKVIGKITDPAWKEAIHHFTIPRSEMDNFKDAYLQFRASCEQKDIGNLLIELNGRTISSTTPACDSTNYIDIFSEDLMLGKNEITFTLEEGKARLESAKIRINLKEQKGFTDFFTIEEDKWEKIKDDKKKAVLDIEFIDDNIRKKLEVNVNGRRHIMDQREPHYTRDITKYAKAGNNYIQLLPLTEITIVDLEVRLEDE